MKLPGVKFWVRWTRVAIACFVALWFARGLNPVATVYSAAYNGYRLHRLRVGMAAQEVEAVMGPPLAKVRWGDDTENWMFSQGAGGAFSWRRWVIFTHGKLDTVVSDLFEND